MSARTVPSTPRAASAPQRLESGNIPSVQAAEATGPTVRVQLRPVPGSAPRLWVEVDISGIAVGNAVTLRRGSVEQIHDLEFEDASGVLPARLVNDPPGVRAVLERPAFGNRLRVRYALSATADVGAPSTAVVVAADRFRALGESVLLLPDAVESQPALLHVQIEGKDIVAPASASSLGLGARSRDGRARMLLHSGFLAGSLGTAVFNDGIEHDEFAWLGYTAFDPRAAAAEVALIRSALREIWRGSVHDEHTLLLVSSHAELGGYSLSPRAGSVWVHLNPSEPWSAALRVGITHELVRAWIGGELRMQPIEPGRETETLWFTDGVARYFAARILARLKLLAPEDSRDFVVGLLSAQATSAYRSQPNHAVSEAAKRDPEARALLTARGALYAVQTAALFRAKKLEGGLEAVVLPFLQAARQKRTALDPEAWKGAVARALALPDDPHFEAAVVRGEPIQLANDALGRCFRGAPARYGKFVLGFDARATLATRDKAIVRLDASGPAAKAGLAATDCLQEVTYREGNAEERVKLNVLRDGKALELSYFPRGAESRGQYFARAPAVPALLCGDVL